METHPKNLGSRPLDCIDYGLATMVNRRQPLITLLDVLFRRVGIEVHYPNLRRFAKATHEFAVYIADNADSIINYGERYRAGERISTAFVESTVNAVIGKRFAKRQQMQWTPRGAHLLLQTRTRTLDGTLRPMFERWYPGLANDQAVAIDHAAAA